MRTFVSVWFGQLVSLVGTAMTRFALLIWAYDLTGQATALALLGFFAYGSLVLVSPLAGVWVDRLDRRRVMLAADLGAGLMTLVLLALLALDRLHIAHLYVAQALTGVFEAFQLPAYTAATTLLVPKTHYDRANGLRSLADSASQVMAPFLAGFLLTVIGIEGVMLVDVATFLVAVTTLTLVRFPRAIDGPSLSLGSGRGRVWRDLRLELDYIRQRPGLWGLLLIFVGINFFAALTYFGVLPALILARTGGDELALGSVLGALGLGGVLGSLVVSIWGGPRRRIHGVLAFAAISFFSGDLLFATGQNVGVWVLAGLLAAFFVPFIVAANRGIWQAKVAPELQGRVFALQTMLQQATLPLGYLLAGPLADRVFEPAMSNGGMLTRLFGPLVGVGPGAGMGLMFLGTAILGTLASLSGYLFPAVRNVELELPDAH